ncbi:hypothetical protein SanaruYs_34140 [Chryseotalea sanaruensis]|uniref:DUF998 domain-containing protein n=1 Tax=Chryseotalea sanaruensis TaxID=2482724 RepID=A0A401UE40_9BACT|nr:DUF998 domain-containing protein [Chryseotalea sanaruensis]GCC53171.1 hypothetical protein SanaruYs_34140 [Chryseotalea sanaruensis]
MEKRPLIKKEDSRKERPAQKMVALPGWQRITLLIVLGYEGAGCLLGGTLLVAAPDGRYMDMPTTMMHGVFSDFLIPGIILFGLGILNTFAFFTVLRRAASDWFMAGLALGGLFIWFVVEIIILQELHWLHAMWGIPVLLGLVVTIPLIVLRHDTAIMRKALLSCGILSSLWYVAINIFVPMMYDGYSMASLTVSELSAIGASTRIVWVLLAMLYLLLLIAFGWGVLKSSGHSRQLRIAGNLIIAYCIMNFYWPPMHQREVIAAGGGTLTDTLHIIWAMMTLLFNMLLMGFGAAALGKRFRIYTIATWLVFIVFGILTFMESPGIEANLPTPHIGLWERINMGAFLLWIIVFAFVLLKIERLFNSINGSEHLVNSSTNA